MTVLLLTTEPLPLPGSATTGAGLRAWGLCEGLRASGLDVVIGTPLIADQSPPPLAANVRHVRFFSRKAIGALLAEVQPGVVVLQHWGLAAEVPELSVPLVIDLAGPHLLERMYWGSGDTNRDVEEKLAALRRADFVTCSGFYQRHYFYPFLAMAGFDVTKTDCPVIPFSTPPAVGEPRAERPETGDVTFVYGGAFLAWQDPRAAIMWLLEEMDAADTGRLLFYGGAHPVIDASGGKFAELARALESHPRVEMRGWKPFNELLKEYQSECDVALDLMARNPERELAFTTRTMIYLHCGLPVIYNNYSELSPIIAGAGAGWTLDPADEQGFRVLVRRILKREIALQDFGQRAVELAAQYDWTKTVGPLAEFCRSPYVRPGKVEFALAHEHRRLGSERANGAQYAASGIRSLLNRTKLLSRLSAPFVYLIAWLIVLYMRFRLRKTTV